MNSGRLEVAFAPITLPSTTVPTLIVRQADVVKCGNAVTEPESTDCHRAFVPEVVSNHTPPSYRGKIASEGGRRSSIPRFTENAQLGSGTHAGISPL